MSFTEDDLRRFAEAVPFSNHLGVKIIELTPEKVVCTVIPQAEHCTTMNTVHGGFLMAVADFAGASGAFFNLPEGSTGTTTTESKTNMIRPGQPGTTLTITSTPINIGRRLQVWQTRIEDEDGKLVSLTTQTQINL